MAQGATVAAFFAVVVGASLFAATARRLAVSGDLPSLDGWALADRRLGAGWTWLVLGGTIFTAYTFIAVPGLVYGVGAFGFFAVPYTVVVCPVIFLLLPRFWVVARRNGYVTAADFVRGRFGSPALALVIALTGILATMPYLALQLVGVRAVLAAAGLHPAGARGDLVMVAVFAALAVATYRHGLRAPAVIAVVKSVAVFGSVVAVAAFALHTLGGPGAIFDAAAPRLARHAPPGASLTGLEPNQYAAYSSLALGSALALPMYPHVLTAGFAASGPDALRRAAVALPAWTMVLGVFGLLGVTALAAGIHTPPGHTEEALPLLVNRLMPPAAAGLVFGSIAVGALVPAAVMSISAATCFVRNIHVEFFDPTATPKRQVRTARWVSIAAKAGAVAFVLGLRAQDAIDLQLLGGVWILQTFPAVAAGLYTRWLHQGALLAGWGVGMAAGTALVLRGGFSQVVPITIGSHAARLYAGLVALAVNMAVAVVLTLVLDRLGVPRRRDLTAMVPSPAPASGLQAGGVAA
ncbi:MAG: sodium:solute symporter [Catenulisporales bacterium]|nr:sodium:solute symporter [Catenulisporales bacterium]